MNERIETIDVKSFHRNIIEHLVCIYKFYIVKTSPTDFSKMEK